MLYSTPTVMIKFLKINNIVKFKQMNKKFFSVILITAVFAAVFTSCKKDKETYTITFNSKDGSEVAAQTINKGEKVTEPQPAPTREGYLFGGWYTDNPTLTNKWDFDTDVVTENITLYAKWGTVKLLETVTSCFRNYDELNYDAGCYDMYKFEYDEQNRVTKRFHYYGVDLYNITTYTYTGDDFVQVLHNYSSSSVEMYEYTKSGNTITQKITHSARTYTIELDSDGLPVKKEDLSGNYHYIYTYEYNDGNMTKETECIRLPEYDYKEGECYTRTYYYDNQKGALYHCKTPKWCLILHLNDFGVNNNKTEDGFFQRYSAKFTYEFDDIGFPIRRTCRSVTGMSSWVSVWVEEFIYIVK